MMESETRKLLLDMALKIYLSLNLEEREELAADCSDTAEALCMDAALALLKESHKAVSRYYTED